IWPGVCLLVSQAVHGPLVQLFCLAVSDWPYQPLQLSFASNHRGIVVVEAVSRSAGHDVRRSLSSKLLAPPPHQPIELPLKQTSPPPLAFAATIITTANAMNATGPRIFRSFTTALVNGAPWRAPQCLFSARRDASST